MERGKRGEIREALMSVQRRFRTDTRQWKGAKLKKETKKKKQKVVGDSAHQGTSQSTKD